MKLVIDDVSPTPHLGATQQFLLMKKCPGCSGKGLIEEEEITDYHRNDYYTWTESCRVCDGSGRLAIRVMIEVTKYVQPTPDK